jgi:hypothetical protein
MSTPFYDLASLVFLPSGYKSGKLYAQKPQTTDGQLAFTRASTATRVNASGLIEAVATGVPRLDYLNSTCPKLLLEPQRTNLVLYSEQIDNAAWNKLNTTISANAAAAPDGTTSADLVYPTTTGAEWLIEQAIAATIGQTWTSSFFVKASGFSWVLVYSPNLGACWFNASTGSFGTIAAGVTATVLGQVNGFWRVSFTGTIASSNAYFYAGPADANNSTTATTSGTNGLLFWGCQLEQGAYATSYIPTLGTSVTRVADDCVKTSATALIGQTEGVAFVDFQFTGNYSSGGIIPICLDGGTGLEMYFWVQTDGTMLFEVLNSTSQVAISGSIGAVGRKKVAIAYKQNDFVLYVNGVQIGTDTSGTIPACNRLYVGRYYLNSAYNMTSGVNQALLFKTRLTNAQLAELTA